MDNEVKPVRFVVVARGFLDYFAATVGVISLVVGGAALIWNFSPVITYTVSVAAGMVVGIEGGVEKYRSTKKKIIKQKEDNAKIDMVVAELEARHDLTQAHNRDVTSQLSTLVARPGSHREVRRIRRQSHLHPAPSPSQESPIIASRATTFNISVDPAAAAAGMQLDLRRNPEGGISVLTYPSNRPSDSPSTPGLLHRITPPPVLDMTHRDEKPDEPSPTSTPRM